MGVGAAVAAGVGLVGAGVAYKTSQDQKKAAQKGLGQSKKAARANAAYREQQSAQVREDIGLATNELKSSEAARGLVQSQLGAPGTYGPGSSFNFAPRGLAGVSAPGQAPGGLYGIDQDAIDSGEVADPNVTAAGIMNQPSFGIASGMVAEADQLMNRSGPLWRTLNDSIVGAVYEGSATSQRQQLEQLSRATARGGNARKAAVALAQEFQVQENINATRTKELWNARSFLEKYRIEAAQKNMTFANDWVNNQAGIRDDYVSTLTELRSFWSRTIPAAAMASGSSDLRGEQTAISQHNAGLMAAANTKAEAIMGAVESFAGAAMHAYDNNQTPDQPTATMPSVPGQPATNLVASGQGTP